MQEHFCLDRAGESALNFDDPPLRELVGIGKQIDPGGTIEIDLYGC